MSGSQFQVTVHHCRENQGSRNLKQLVPTQPHSRARAMNERMPKFSRLSPFHSAQGPAHEMVSHAFRVGLPIQSTQLRKMPTGQPNSENPSLILPSLPRWLRIFSNQNHRDGKSYETGQWLVLLVLNFYGRRQTETLGFRKGISCLLTDYPTFLHSLLETDPSLLHCCATNIRKHWKRERGGGGGCRSVW